jgi:hypothetical protein
MGKLVLKLLKKNSQISYTAPKKLDEKSGKMSRRSLDQEIKINLRRTKKGWPRKLVVPSQRKWVVQRTIHPQ